MADQTDNALASCFFSPGGGLSSALRTREGPTCLLYSLKAKPHRSSNQEVRALDRSIQEDGRWRELELVPI